MAASEPTTGSLAASLTQEILHELITDIAIEEHELCQFRRNRLNQYEFSLSLSLPPFNSSVNISFLYQRLYYEQQQNGLLNVNGTASNSGSNGISPTKRERDEGLFSCVVCNRQIAAPRYASHLSGCMGLSGSRRGERRAAANAAGVNGKPNRNGSGASSHGSDTDTEKKNGLNGLKRSASTTSASSQNKKSRPTPLSSTPSSSQTFQPPHIGSHPLSKTMSLPASPVDSPTASYPQIPPRPSSVAPGALPPSQQPQLHQQQQRIPSKQPISSSSIPPLPPPPQQQQQIRPHHPLSQPPIPTSSQQPVRSQNDDRPDSDSEDSDSDLEIQSITTTRPSTTSNKTPRVPPGGGMGIGMQRNGSTITGGGNSSQKQPRKGIKSNGTGGGPTGGIGRKAARPIARVNNDSASSDDDASDGSGSD
ncbi:hypothetical protein JCM3765_007798 [Sporobolomyces pararoseus]